MTNEELERQKAEVRTHPDYAQAVELIGQIKRLEMEIGHKKLKLAGLDIYGQQAVMDDQMARLNVLIERAATA